MVMMMMLVVMVMDDEYKSNDNNDGHKDDSDGDCRSYYLYFTSPETLRHFLKFSE